MHPYEAKILLNIYTFRKKIVLCNKALSNCAVQEVHQHENLETKQLQLLPDDLATLNRLFPPPMRKTPLAML